MSSWDTLQETPNQPASRIAFTAGSTITISAPASKVFGIILDHDNYAKWNTWSPKFVFKDGKGVSVGSEGVLTAAMENQGNKSYEVPVKILECSPEATGSGPFVLAWQGQLLPSWFGMAERVQIITSIEDGQTCEVKNWESMSGWGAYVLNFILGVKTQLLQSNLKYLEDLKAFAEQ